MKVDIHVYLSPKNAKGISKVARMNRRSVTAEAELAIEHHIAKEMDLAKAKNVKSKRNNPSA